ncbi:MAG: hypothetical protein GY889_06280 [Proteobacteria bacterium]|nr:hypothetical protein [Pseudomonadota bacterium]
MEAKLIQIANDVIAGMFDSCRGAEDSAGHAGYLENCLLSQTTYELHREGYCVPFENYPVDIFQYISTKEWEDLEEEEEDQIFSYLKDVWPDQWRDAMS